MKDRVLSLRNESFRMAPLDERESLYNDLTQIAQNYDSGQFWDDDADNMDDD